MLLRSAIIAALLLLFASCSFPQGPRSRTELQPASPVEHLTARMALRVLDAPAGGEEGARGQRVHIVVLNPEAVPIQSVRAWVQYDATQLTVTDLVVEDGRFVLFAPGERTIDPAQGMVKIGAAVAHSLSDREITVASFRVTRKRRITGEEPVLSFYDWDAEGEGHTALLSVTDGRATNVLQAPLSLAL